MKRLEIVKENRRRHEAVREQLGSMSGLEKAVAENVILEWLSSNNWMGGLSDSRAQKIYEKVARMGYSFEEIDTEFQKQMMA